MSRDASATVSTNKKGGFDPALAQGAAHGPAAQIEASI